MNIIEHPQKTANSVVIFRERVESWVKDNNISMAPLVTGDGFLQEFEDGVDLL